VRAAGGAGLLGVDHAAHEKSQVLGEIQLLHGAQQEILRQGAVEKQGLAAVVAAFGDEVLDAEGGLDRPAMRRRVFADPAARHRLEAIIHPRVRHWLHERALADTTPYCLLAIPLLVENIAHYRWVDRILLVDAPVEQQLARLIARDAIDEALARRMLAQQARREERLAPAHDVIDNSGADAALDAAVLALHQRYLALAATR